VKITKVLRRVAKAVSFGIIYGRNEANTDKAAGFPGAYKLFVSKFTQLPIIKEELIKFANKHGYVETLFGYQLDVPTDRINTTVIDYVCQGTAGDIIKNATIAIDKKGLVDWKHSAILLQVHDSLIFEVDDTPKYNNVKFLSAVVKEMEQAGADLGVKTPVDIDMIKDDWSNGQKVTIEGTNMIIAA
jgi:DNA polymerase-1